MQENSCACRVVQVGLKKYSSVSPSAFGLVGRKRIAVIRSAGAIVGGASYAKPFAPACWPWTNLLCSAVQMLLN